MLDLYETLADIVQGWSKTTKTVVLLVIVAVTFYLYARALIGLKEGKKITNWVTIFIFFVSFAVLMLYISCMNY